MIYAKLDNQNIVIQVIMADAAYIETQEGNWVEAHEDGQPITGIEDTYIPEMDFFLEPKPGLKWKLSPEYVWVRPSGWKVLPGEPIQGIYKLPLKDSNGKQLYTKSIEGPNKADARKVPLVIVGICLDIRN